MSLTDTELEALERAYDNPLLSVQSAVEAIVAARLAPALAPLPKNETPDDLRWYATHEALCRHSIFDVLMWLADARAALEAAS